MGTNILITSCSRDVTLVKAFRAALINNGGGKVIAADISPLAAALYFADEYVIVPRSDEKGFVQFLLELCKKKEIHLLLTSRDAELVVLAEAKAQFEAMGVRVMTASLETVQTCRDKRLFCEFCEKHDIPVPETFTDEENIRFPAFIKPVIGAGSMKIHKVENRKEYYLLKEVYRGDFLVQEFIDWPEYTVDVFADFEGRVISVIPRERLLTVGGESYIGKTVKNKIIINYCLRLARSLGLIGHNTLQCFFNGGDIKFIEVNPRFGGGANLGFAAGVNTPELLVRLLRGEKIEPMISEFIENLVMLRYTQDVFFETGHETGSVGVESLVDVRGGESGRIYCIDVDGTVCTERVEYEKALPIEKTVRKINELYDKGNTIILYTARGAYSGKDWSGLTEQQLKAWGVKYHQFLQGKPFAHEYIDNKAVHILDWI